MVWEPTPVARKILKLCPPDASGYNFKADAGYGYASRNDDYVHGSVSLLHRVSGINLHVAHGQYDDGRFYANTKAGIIGDFLGFGESYKTAFSLQRTYGDDLNGEGTSINYTSASTVQNLGPNLQLYVQLGLQEYDDTVNSYLDGKITFAGVRYVFDF
ncbi:MAG: hypothetical protein AAF665_04810 [Pseudomonadota bacterium]